MPGPIQPEDMLLDVDLRPEMGCWSGRLVLGRGEGWRLAWFFRIEEIREAYKAQRLCILWNKFDIEIGKGGEYIAFGRGSKIPKTVALQKQAVRNIGWIYLHRREELLLTSASSSDARVHCLNRGHVALMRDFQPMHHAMPIKIVDKSINQHKLLCLLVDPLSIVVLIGKEQLFKLEIRGC